MSGQQVGGQQVAVSMNRMLVVGSAAVSGQQVGGQQVAVSLAVLGSRCLEKTAEHPAQLPPGIPEVSGDPSVLPQPASINGQWLACGDSTALGLGSADIGSADTCIGSAVN